MYKYTIQQMQTVKFLMYLLGFNWDTYNYYLITSSFQETSQKVIRKLFGKYKPIHCHRGQINSVQQQAAIFSRQAGSSAPSRVDRYYFNKNIPIDFYNYSIDFLLQVLCILMSCVLTLKKANINPSMTSNTALAIQLYL